ncbi:P-loop containing nucleoside triphosphate hydrolase protein [Cladorrhinum samala]|uniref:P-loop containing nucleoside triphosphate hydrolase protein n=1 Tax=Cladorrhinum samala TaxID=585594 RepID=A0AAV9I5B6_9PEZI|nr:P-loop containing nucleoside triphosphate hydrolase protein [Cladorrhinum samala]
MFTTAPAHRCRNGQTKLLAGLLVLKNGQLGSAGRTCRFRAAVRCYSAEAAHHEARVDSIRNIGIIAHVDAGKTTTTERMLYHSGRTRHIGNVDHGNTTTDFLPMERQRGITIQSAAVTFQWPPKSVCPPGQEPRTVNLIDTPGHQDFRYEVDRCLPILDGAVCILDSVKGVETHTERVWESAHISSIPRLLFVNKLDRDGASFRRSVQEVATRLKTWPLLCQIPWWNKDDLLGVIDIVHEVGLRFTPNSGAMTVVSKDSIAKENPALREELDKARLNLLETLSEHDEEVFAEFLEHEKNVSGAVIKKSIRSLIRDGKARFTPVFAGASLRNIGVQPLLDAVVDYLPSPDERPELRVIANSKTIPMSQLFEMGAKKRGHIQHQQPVSSIAHVFKVVDDPKRGVMSWVRVYHGGLSRSSHMWNSNMHAFEKPQNIMHVSAKDYHDIQSLHTGHIGAMTGLKQARTGDSLLVFPGHSGSVAPEAFRSVRIKAPETPPAVAFISIEPYTKTFSEKIEDALKRLEREDPSIRWSKDEKTEQLILSGMGLLHLEIAVDRLLTHYKIDKDSAVWGEIEVEYSETLLAPTNTERAIYDRTLRDKPGKAACTAMLEPLDACHHDSLLESSVERDGNIIHIQIPLPPSGTLPFDSETVRQQLLNGAIAGLARGPRRSCPVRNATVHITFDPSTDWFGSTLSTGGHITNAALFAVRSALKESQMGILEPYSRFSITCPEEAAHAVQHDIVSGRGGQVLEVIDQEAHRSGEEEASEINLEKIYAPPDPYETVQSLRDDKKGKAVRMLELKGKAPLKEMMKYDGHLRSLTGGRHTLQLDQGGWEMVVGWREKALERGQV